MLACTCVVKNYGKQTVVNNFNHVFCNQKTKIIGKNGSGKSTLLRLLCGLEKPTKGEIKSSIPLSELVSISTDSIEPPEFLLVNEITKLFCTYGTFNKDYYQKTVKQLHLNEFENKTFASLSTGTRKKFSIIWALSQRSQVLILDEPFASLDKNSQMQFKALILEDLRALIFVDHEDILDFDESVNV